MPWANMISFMPRFFRVLAWELAVAGWLKNGREMTARSNTVFLNVYPFFGKVRVMANILPQKFREC